MKDKNMKTLVIVPCGKAKIWDKNPEPTYVKASEVYTSTFFRLNREYACSFGDHWIILSAKYGFIEPEKMIENYDVSFNSKKSTPVSTETLKEQVKILELNSFNRIIGLGGLVYRRKISESFEDYQIDIVFPFENCTGIGEMQKAIKSSINNKNQL